MQEEAKIEGIIVPHTHWDREWYLTFQEYRLRLVEVIDRLLKLFEEEPGYRCFMLDGQTSPLEDYLEIKPQNEDVLRKYISEGRLLIGPWFTQPDESLASPEAIVRNLLIGHRIAYRYGHVMKVGYVPDIFGHIPQLPQILQGFGIDSAIFMRGMGDEGEKLPLEFLWEAPDGSKVIAVHLIYGYCNLNLYGYEADIWKGPEGWITAYLKIYEHPPSIDIDKICERIRDLAKRLLPKSATKVLLLMNGCDHQPPQPEILEVMKRLREKYPEYNLRIGSLEEFIELARKVKDKLPTYKGELRGARYHFLLVGVLSTRIYLKQLNYRAQILLENYAEPLSYFATLLGVPHPHNVLTLAWKEILRNHAHDSIYGSSTDPVHKENEVRFLRAIEIASNLAYKAAHAISKASSGPSHGLERIWVYNPLNWRIDSPVTLLLPPPPNGKVYLVVDSKGNKIPVGIIGKETYWQNLVKATFTARNLPPCGYKVYTLIQEESGSSESSKTLKAEGNLIENEFFRIEADPSRGGALKIVDKELGLVLEDLNIFIDEGDAGDEYNYSPPREKDVRVESTAFPAIVKAEANPAFARLRIELIMKVPEKIEGQRRSSKLVELPIVSEVYLYPGIRRIDIITELDNRAEDHRLRVKFPTPFRVSECYVDGHFYVIKRSVKPVSKGEGWKEPPPTTHPQLYWVDVSNGKLGLMIANKGLPEYEAREEDKGVSVYLTLLRAVGWLSRSDLVTRPGHAGPQIPVPEAQCKRKLLFEYSLIPHKGSWIDSKAYKEARSFVIPPLAIVMPTKTSENILPCEHSFINIEPDTLVLTAIKKCEDSEEMVVRFYNISDAEVTAKIKLGFEAERAWIANLNEEKLREIKLMSPNELSMNVAPHKIVTLILRSRPLRAK